MRHFAVVIFLFALLIALQAFVHFGLGGKPGRIASFVESTAAIAQFSVAKYATARPPRITVKQQCLKREARSVIGATALRAICERALPAGRRLRVGVWAPGLFPDSGPWTTREHLGKWVWARIFGAVSNGTVVRAVDAECVRFVVITSEAELANHRFVFGVDGIPERLLKGRAPPARRLSPAFARGDAKVPRRPKHRAAAVFGGSSWVAQDCLHTTDAVRQRVSQELDFGLVIFYDCSVVDSTRVFQWPIGAVTSAGVFMLDRRAAGQEPSPLPLSARAFDLVHVASITRNREGRVEAFDAAQRICADRRAVDPTSECFLRLTGDFLRGEVASGLRPLVSGLSPGAVSRLDEWARGDGAGPNSRYIELLRQSRLVLCPAGHNPESYRIYEALEAGAVPILHDTCWAKSDVANELQCSCGGWADYLKESGAPFPILSSWDELDTVARPLLESPERMDAMQRDTQAWYRRSSTGFRNLIAANMLLRVNNVRNPDRDYL